MVKEKRELRPGDKIIAKGETVVIGKVLFQDFYVDKLYYQLGEKGPDNSYVDIEFLDKKGHYRHYRSYLDGGHWEYAPEPEEKEKEGKKPYFLKCSGAGWAKVNLGVYSGPASYLDDVPVMVLKKLTGYLNDAIGDTKKKSADRCRECLYCAKPLELVFDAEGYHFGLCVFDEDVYIFHTDTDDGVPKLELYTGFSPTTEGGVLVRIAELLCMAIVDIRNDIENWCKFPFLDDEELSDAELMSRRKKEVEEVLKKAETAMEDYRVIYAMSIK